MRNAREYWKQAHAEPTRVFTTLTTAIKEGQGLCYDADRGTITEADGTRRKVVEAPSRTNNMLFAGVSADAYAASATGQFIDIYEPGSDCNVLVGLVTVGTTNAQTILTCSANTPDAGWFTRPGFIGRGTAIALQTLAVSATLDTPISASLDGTASVGAGDKVLTKSSLFTNALVGDTVVILGGSVTATGATAVTPGRYTIATRTSANAVVLSSSPCAAASIVNCYVVRETNKSPVCFCHLFDGDESGLQQTVASITAAETTPATMAGGTTYVVGGQTIAGDTVLTLADGGVGGVFRKAFQLNGALTTNTAAITSANMHKYDLSASATFKLAADLDFLQLAWAAGGWVYVGGDGTQA